MSDQRLEILERENELLRERVIQLEDALFATAVDVPWEWGLTHSERRVFGVLLSRTLATKEAVMAALYTDHGRDEPEIKIVDVFVCKIRAKLRPFGVHIITRWGQGYELDAADKQKLRAAA